MVVGTVTEVVEESQELFDYIVHERSWGMGMDEVKALGRQMALGLAAVHSRNCAHRDIKPENVLIDRDGRIKVIDFGFLRNMTSAEGGRTFTACGTPDYVAPEVVMGKGYGVKVDAWSLGIVLYVMATGTVVPSFASSHPPTLFNNIIRFSESGKTFESVNRSLTMNSLSPELWDLLNHLICHESRRMTVAEALKHPFFRSRQ